MARNFISRQQQREIAAQLDIPRGLVPHHRKTLEQIADGMLDRAAGKRSAAARRGRPATVQDAWVGMLSPVFSGGTYFTGTYSDEYGLRNGLMVSRNVRKDFERFLREMGHNHARYFLGVETHRHRSVLHLHAVLDFAPSEANLHRLKVFWEVHRGWAKVLPVRDGCASYVTKYALKGNVDNFSWGGF